MGWTERRGVKATFSFDKFLSLTTATKKATQNGWCYGALGEIAALCLSFGLPAATTTLSFVNKLTSWVLISHNRNKKATRNGWLYGALGEIRTHDPCLRRAILYPAELQAQTALDITLKVYTFFFVFQVFFSKMRSFFPKILFSWLFYKKG